MSIRLEFPNLCPLSASSLRDFVLISMERYPGVAAGASRLRYSVSIKITESHFRPAFDLDNYAKPILDAITQSELIWRDDRQIDRLEVMRTREYSEANTSASVSVKIMEGQHHGLPAFFQGLCDGARTGKHGYVDVGFTFAKCLAGEIPYDIDDIEWERRVETLLAHLAINERRNALNWLKEHFPRMLDHIPAERHNQFLDGIRRAYSEDWIRF
jgi:hypothetical protein